MGVHVGSVTAVVDPAAVWDRWTDPDHWVADDPRIAQAKLNGPLAKGAVGLVKPAKGRKASFRIVSVDRQKMRFTVESKRPLATLTLERMLDPVPPTEAADGSTQEALPVDPDARVITHRLTIKGPLSALWDRLVGKPWTAEQPTVLANIVAAASR